MPATTVDQADARAREYLIDKIGHAENWVDLNEAVDDARATITTDLLIALDRAVHLADADAMALVRKARDTFDGLRERINRANDAAAARLRESVTQ